MPSPTNEQLYEMFRILYDYLQDVDASHSEAIRKLKKHIGDSRIQD